MFTKICPYGYKTCEYLKRKLCDKAQIKRCKVFKDTLRDTK